MEFLATTVRGLEEIAIEEIEEITGRGADVEHEGMVGFNGRIEDIFKLNYLSKTLHRVLVLLSRFEVTDLEDVYRESRRINFSEYINSSQKFAARTKRFGDHNFSSMDVESELGQAVVDSFEERGSSIEVDLDNPDVYLRSELRGEKFWVAVDTTGEDSLHKRSYRKYEHPAPLKPTIAYCLVRLSEWGEDEGFLDPMCGSGTICIEAWHWKNDILNWFRENYDFWNLQFVDRDEFLGLKSKYDFKAENKSLKIEGYDLFEKHVKGARKNAVSADVDIQISKEDATEFSLDADKIVTNPPYGMRVGSKEEIKDLYENFNSNLEDHQWRKTVILTGKPNYFPKKYLEKKLNLYYGNLPVSVLVLEK